MKVLMVLPLLLLTGCAGLGFKPAEPEKPVQPERNSAAEVVKLLFDHGCDITEFDQSERFKSLKIRCQYADR